MKTTPSKASIARIIIQRLAKRITMVKFGLLVVMLLIIGCVLLLSYQLKTINTRLTSIEQQQYRNISNLKDMEQHFTTIDNLSTKLQKSQLLPSESVVDNALKYQILKTVYSIRKRITNYTNITNELLFLKEHLPEYKSTLESLESRNGELVSDHHLIEMIDALSKQLVPISNPSSMWGKIKAQMQDIISIKTQAEYDLEQSMQHNISLLKEAVANKDYEKAIKISLTLKLSQSSLTKILEVLKYRADLHKLLENIFVDSIKND